MDPLEASYWHLPIEFDHDRLQKVKVILFCSLERKRNERY